MKQDGSGKGGAALGVAKAVGKGLLKKAGMVVAAKLAIPVAVVLLLVLAVAAIGVTVSDNDLTAVTEQVPNEETVERYGQEPMYGLEQVAARHDIPWNILVALFDWATFGGVRSPYPGDTLERGRVEGTSRFPVVSPPIEPGVYGPPRQLVVDDPPAPPANLDREQARVLMVGDQVLGTVLNGRLRSFLEGQGWTVTDSVIRAGLTVADVVEVVQANRDAGTLPPFVVVNAGVNDPPDEQAAAEGVRAVLNAAGESRVVWVSVVRPPDDFLFNSVLTQVAAEPGSRLSVADWKTLSDGAVGWFEQDGRTPTQVGLPYLADTIAVELRRIQPVTGSVPGEVTQPEVRQELTRIEDPWGYDSGGFGPFLLVGDVGFDRQDVLRSADLVARHTGEIAKRLARERDVNYEMASTPSLVNTADYASFWADVLSQVAVTRYSSSWSNPVPEDVPQSGVCSSTGAQIPDSVLMVKVVPCPAPPLVPDPNWVPPPAPRVPDPNYQAPSPPLIPVPGWRPPPPPWPDGIRPSPPLVPDPNWVPPEPTTVPDPNWVPPPPPLVRQPGFVAPPLLPEGAVIVSGAAQLLNGAVPVVSVSTGIPSTLPPLVAQAVAQAVDWGRVTFPQCGLNGAFLASFMRIEAGGFWSRADSTGTAVPPVIGPDLRVSNLAASRDTDGGRLDGLSDQDRAVGYSQFMPGTWVGYESRYGSQLDGNNDGNIDPQNLFDAARATTAYVCERVINPPRWWEGPGDLGNVEFRKRMGMAYFAGDGGVLSPGPATVAYGDRLEQYYQEYLAVSTGGVPGGVGCAGGFPTQPVGQDQVVLVAGRTRVHVCIAEQITRLYAEADGAGIPLAGGGWRSVESQIQLRQANGCPDIFTAPSSSCRVPTARPGNSMHERGLAIDFTCAGRIIGSRSGVCWEWLAANASRFGLFPLSSEPWHWSVNGN